MSITIREIHDLENPRHPNDNDHILANFDHKLNNRYLVEYKEATYDLSRILNDAHILREYGVIKTIRLKEFLEKDIAQVFKLADGESLVKYVMIKSFHEYKDFKVFAVNENDISDLKHVGTKEVSAYPDILIKGPQEIIDQVIPLVQGKLPIFTKFENSLILKDCNVLISSELDLSFFDVGKAFDFKIIDLNKNLKSIEGSNANFTVSEKLEHTPIFFLDGTLMMVGTFKYKKKADKKFTLGLNLHTFFNKTTVDEIFTEGKANYAIVPNKTVRSKKLEVGQSTRPRITGSDLLKYFETVNTVDTHKMYRIVMVDNKIIPFVVTDTEHHFQRNEDTEFKEVLVEKSFANTEHERISRNGFSNVDFLGKDDIGSESIHTEIKTKELDTLIYNKVKHITGIAPQIISLYVVE